MIPLIDDYLRDYLLEKLRFLKAHPALVDRIFSTGNRSTLKSLKDFITKRSVKVSIGYPKDQTSLPCYVIVLAPEQEVPLGLGDGEEEYFEELDVDEEDIEQIALNELDKYINGTYMNGSYRIECWSDNGDLTSYMYAILKWCLWTSKMQMIRQGWVNITLSGTDLEPVPDYMPVFIYRRSIVINLQAENLFYNDTISVSNLIDVAGKPDDYEKDEDDNIVDKKTGEVVIPATTVWLIRSNYFYRYNNQDTKTKLFNETILNFDDPKVKEAWEKILEEKLDPVEDEDGDE